MFDFVPISGKSVKIVSAVCKPIPGIKIIDESHESIYRFFDEHDALFVGANEELLSFKFITTFVKMADHCNLEK